MTLVEWSKKNVWKKKARPKRAQTNITNYCVDSDSDDDRKPAAN